MRSCIEYMSPCRHHLRYINRVPSYASVLFSSSFLSMNENPWQDWLKRIVVQTFHLIIDQFIAVKVLDVKPLVTFIITEYANSLTNRMTKNYKSLTVLRFQKPRTSQSFVLALDHSASLDPLG